MEARSIYREGLAEALRHKWIQSEKSGCDLGEEAVSDWYRRYWNMFCRIKRLEHLTGSCLWQEFGKEDFGRIQALLREENLLFAEILDHAYQGMENLDIIVWAQRHHTRDDVERILEMLTLLNLNSARLDPAQIPPGPPRFAMQRELPTTSTTVIEQEVIWTVSATGADEPLDYDTEPGSAGSPDGLST